MEVNENTMQVVKYSTACAAFDVFKGDGPCTLVLCPCPPRDRKIFLPHQVLSNFSEVLTRTNPPTIIAFNQTKMSCTFDGCVHKATRIDRYEINAVCELRMDLLSRVCMRACHLFFIFIFYFVCSSNLFLFAFG